MKNNIDSFADYVKSKRIEACISQRDLAKHTGLSHTSISRYESGYSNNPSIKALIKLGIALKFTLEDIESYF